MARNALRALLILVGAGMILLALTGDHRDPTSPVWWAVIGLGLILAPIRAATYLVLYLLFLVALFGPALAILFVTAEIAGENPWLLVPAFAGGLLAGFKLFTSAAFGALIDQLRRASR